MPKSVDVGEQSIGLTRVGSEDYFSLTDIAKYRSEEPNDVIRSWLRLKDTLSYLSVWETLNNQDFDAEAAATASTDAGRNSFTMSPKRWTDSTRSIGIISKTGRGGGTYAHSDIAFQFASWLSPEFQLYIITEYKRLKAVEVLQESQEWKLQRELSKINYRIHTDSIKESLIPAGLTREQTRAIYADEADMLNVVVFGLTAREWKARNPEVNGNMRDFASHVQLLVLSNLQVQNATYIDEHIPQEQRIQKLRDAAVRQLTSLQRVDVSGKLKALDDASNAS